MIGHDRVAALIPARGGSKSIPGKNIRLLGGKPLLAWSIDSARQTPEIDRIIVSTDDAAIAATARDCGAEVWDRPAHLAQDDSLVIDTIRHVIATLKQEGDKASILVLLEATSPLRLPEDVSRCLKLLVQEKPAFDSVATFKEADLNPHRAFRIENEQVEPFVPHAVPWLPRQKQPRAYQLNGAVYAFFIDRLPVDALGPMTGRIGAVHMPKERSIDIDGPVEFAVAEAFINGAIHAGALS